MPSSKLTGVLAGLGGEGARLIKGTITAVSTGLLTVQVNGDTFQRVPYLDGGASGWVPQVSAQVYLLAQDDFGILAIGSPASVPPPPAPVSPTVTTVDPSTVANWRVPADSGSGTWVDLTGRLLETPPFVDTGVWFYPSASLAAITFDVGALTMQMEMVSGGPLDLILHTSSGPTGSFTPVANGEIRSVNPPVGVSQVSLPLGWAYQLIAGTARGIAMQSRTNTAEVFAHGTLTFTSL